MNKKIREERDRKWEEKWAAERRRDALKAAVDKAREAVIAAAKEWADFETVSQSYVAQDRLMEKVRDLREAEEAYEAEVEKQNARSWPTNTF